MAQQKFISVIAAFLTVALSAGCANTSAPTADVRAILAAADRTDADRQVDVRRKAELLFGFTGISAGMRVLDMGVFAGYSTEMIARMVGPTGTVYAQDSKMIIETLVKDRFDVRAKKDVMKNVVRVVRDYDDPAPPNVGGLDVITFFFAYHDTAWMDVDRAKMNQRLFAALKPGGTLIVADHSAKMGDGINVVKSLHRIEESVLRREIEAAGFRLVDTGNFLRNPDDPRDARVFQPKVPVDEFVLKFRKP